MRRAVTSERFEERGSLRLKSENPHGFLLHWCNTPLQCLVSERIVGIGCGRRSWEESKDLFNHSRNFQIT
jgi:hypothetical protein